MEAHNIVCATKYLVQSSVSCLKRKLL